MKKNVLLIILGVVTVICIIAGTIKHVGGGIKTVKENGFFWDYDDSDDDDRISGKKASIDEVLNRFTEIKANTNIGEFRIEQGDQFKIESTYTRDWLKPIYSVNNGRLEISQPHKKHKNIGGTNNCRIILTVPAGTELSQINIDSNVGDVKLRSIVAGDIDINLNVGEISIRQSKFDKVDADTNVGEIDIDADGDIDDYTISASTDVGDVRINGKGFKHSYNSKGNTNKMIKANTNVGEININ